MGHQPPKDPAVAAGIPSLKWPHIWVAITGYLLIACISDFTVGIDSKADAIAALIMLPLCVLFFLAALGFRKHRIAQRQQWREARYIEWLRKPWPAPAVTDWDKFELEAAERVVEEEKNQVKNGSPFSPAITESIAKLAPSGPPPATSYHHPRGKGGMYWDKRDLMRGDWWAR